MKFEIKAINISNKNGVYSIAGSIFSPVTDRMNKITPLRITPSKYLSKCLIELIYILIKIRFKK